MYSTGYHATGYYATPYYLRGPVTEVERKPNKGPYDPWWGYEQIAIREDEEIIMLLTAFAEVLKCR